MKQMYDVNLQNISDWGLMMANAEVHYGEKKKAMGSLSSLLSPKLRKHFLNFHISTQV